MSIPGIDVSDHQPNVDWKKVHQLQVKFAYIKASEGSSFKADTFKRKWKESKTEGISRGAYHFFKPAAPAQKQVDNFLAVLPDNDPGELGPVLDIEVRDGVPASQIREGALAWLERVEAATGRRPTIYTGASFGDDVLSPNPKFGKYPLWVAHYRLGRPSVPRAWATCSIWQYTDKGSVEGAGRIDCNWFNGTLDALTRFGSGDLAGVRADSQFADLINREEDGDHVKTVQQLLIAVGFPVGPAGADGDFGAATESAVMSFQRANRLIVNGIVDPFTREALEQKAGAGASP